MSALEWSGFEVLECSEIWHDYIISAVVRKRMPASLTAFHGACDTLVRELNGYVGRYGAGRVAVWGAGHQALAILALADLGGKIRYVVDSASFKQGKYTPATHVLIVPPVELDRDPVDAVIVMAGGYSDEVGGVLRCKYGKSLDVSILREQGLEII